jgi:hypothetical protein
MEFQMSKKIVLFLLAFGFATSFAHALSPGNPVCVRGCMTSLAACDAQRIYTAAQCSSAYQSCIEMCANPFQ